MSLLARVSAHRRGGGRTGRWFCPHRSPPVLAVLALSLAFSCGLFRSREASPSKVGKARESESKASVPQVSPSSKNPFGVMLPSRVLLSSRRNEVLKALGVSYVRPGSVFVDRWNGSCTECDAVEESGAELVLTVRKSGPGATSPPSDLAEYKKVLDQIVDAYPPALLVVENEENSAIFYSGTPDQYAAQLEAACEVSHNRGIPCTNGGLVGELVSLLVYDHYLELGDLEGARDFAARALHPQTRAQLGSVKVKEQVQKGKALLEAYKASSADFVNFHWYVGDTKALEEAVEYLRSKTAKLVITNEVGQENDDPEQTVRVLAKIVELRLPIAVWFGLDGPKARGLMEKDGTMRPTGMAFGRFINEHYPPEG